jgi:hypothetical protein
VVGPALLAGGLVHLWDRKVGKLREATRHNAELEGVAERVKPRT